MSPAEDVAIVPRRRLSQERYFFYSCVSRAVYPIGTGKIFYMSFDTSTTNFQEKRRKFQKNGGTPFTKPRKCAIIIFVRGKQGALAQLARALHWQCRGHGFESHMLHHENCLFCIRIGVILYPIAIITGSAA